MKNFRVWYLYSINSFQRTLTNRFITLIFIVSKFIRIAMFLFFLDLLLQGVSSLAGYTREQIIFFYLSFNLIDTGSQFLFRNVYSFRPLIVSGDLDLILLKPINPLIRVLLGGMDIMDGIMLLIILAVVVYFGVTSLSVPAFFWLGYFLLIVNSIFISAAFHIFVLGFGVVTTSVDHLILIYRDLTSLMRIPVDVYIEPLRSLLTFVIPLGVMYTFPPKFLIGLLSWQFIVLSFVLSVVFVFISLVFWRRCLRSYQSASS